jgi:hypothetical protein
VPKTVYLGEQGQEPYLELADLTGQDAMEYTFLIDDIRRGKGVPAVIREVNPEDTTEMITRPNPAAEFTARDNYQAFDWLAGRAVSRFPWPLPDGVEKAGDPGYRAAIPLKYSRAFNEVIGEVVDEINNGPKPETTGDTSGSSSDSDAGAPPAE